MISKTRYKLHKKRFTEYHKWKSANPLSTDNSYFGVGSNTIKQRPTTGCWCRDIIKECGEIADDYFGCELCPIYENSFALDFNVVCPIISGELKQADATENLILITDCHYNMSKRKFPPYEQFVELVKTALSTYKPLNETPFFEQLQLKD